MFRRLTVRRPSTGCFQIPVCTVFPSQSTSLGKPTLTDSKRATIVIPRQLIIPDQGFASSTRR
jgi:hypothetical protein